MSSKEMNERGTYITRTLHFMGSINETTYNEIMGKSFPNVTAAAVMEKLEERKEFHENEKIKSEYT